MESRLRFFFFYCISEERCSPLLQLHLGGSKIPTLGTAAFSWPECQFITLYNLRGIVT